ncbi:wd-40 repeat protein [Stylonychia lemnae]|uniref:Wd-40 repeat protein n=1 Tax=Stylonychia lemnae TaxID=5949 RepID=A0A078AW33_STYLE|nr:wd-40 repeat protein [Stylonychia lemnae]|eukprot:CDW85427.1 wd-40 repeat protein [Stylonychia lemnae]
MVESSVLFQQSLDQVNIIIQKSEADQITIKVLIGTSKINQEDKRAQDQLDCPICLQIVYNPVECSNCQKCFCEDCVNSWLQRDRYDSCPLCKQKLVPKQIHRFVRQFIEDTLFEGCKNELCEQQGRKIKYSDLLKHYQYQCEEVKVSCPLQCGSQYLRKQKKLHIDQCTKINYQCRQCGCNKSILEEKQVPHNCIEYLQQQESKFKQKVEEKDKHAIQVKAPQNNGDSGLPQQSDQFWTKLHKYPLEKMTYQQMRKLPGHEGYQISWFCDAKNFLGCKGGQDLMFNFCGDPQTLTYHCDICNFDFCQVCYDFYGNAHKHDLICTTWQQLMQTNEGYKVGWRCDATGYFGCQDQESIRTNHEEVLYHDSIAFFDLCEDCLRKYQVDDDSNDFD